MTSFEPPEIPAEVRVDGRRPNPLALVPLILVGGLLIWETVSSQTWGLLLILAFLAPALLGMLALVLWPPRMEVSGGEFRVRFGGTRLECPRTNVAQIVLDRQVVRMLFADLGVVGPPQRRSSLFAAFQRTGAHFEMGPGYFTLGQVNEVRRALGMVEQPVDEEGERMAAFQREVRASAPRTIGTHLLIALNCLALAGVFAWSYFHKVTFNEALFEWGANHGPTTLGGQWWRIITCMFLHGGLLHLLFNMWVLRDVGRLIERFTGTLPFLVLYLSAGVGGSLASLYWHPNVIGVGASGAVFGLFGAMMAIVLRCHGRVNPASLKSLWSSGLAFLMFNLVFGMMIPQIDMAAHVGGLATGFLAGWVVPLRLNHERFLLRLARTVVIGAVTAAAAFATFQHPPEIPPDLLTEFQTFLEVEQKSMAAYQRLGGQFDRGELKPQEFVRELDREVLEPWRRQEERFGQVRNLTESQQKTVDRLLEYMAVRRKSWETLRRGVLENDPKAIERFHTQWEAADALARKFSDENGE